MQKAKNDKNVYSLFAGIDISKEYFDVSVIDQQGKKLAYDRFSNDSKGIEKFIQWLIEELKLDSFSLLVCMEHTGLYSRMLMLKLLEEQMNVWVDRVAGAIILADQEIFWSS
ncbi:IS110 family transposase [Cesiribacter sp. SM1]|uniref:IS110 family transposase n=1 Tax=Cesiribacter sp. SM1 TaxID=2861196 RepID=UPI001CD4F116|nr:IS110 family transposase [Cesiribacter sp. SM1]